MERKGKKFLIHLNRAVRLSKEFHFGVNKVYVRSERDKLVVSPRQTSWDDYLDRGPIAPADFMSGIDDPSLNERAF